MKRVILLVAALVVPAGALIVYAQSRIPAEIAQYRNWTRMNGAPLTDPSNPAAGPKNTFINLSPTDLKALVAPAGGVRSHFPDGSILVRETLDAKDGWVRALFVMRYDS